MMSTLTRGSGEGKGSRAGGNSHLQALGDAVAMRSSRRRAAALGDNRNGTHLLTRRWLGDEARREAMRTMTILRRTTAIGAIAALPMMPMIAQAESAQVTDVVPSAGSETTGNTASPQGQTGATAGSDAGKSDSSGDADPGNKTGAELKSDQSEAGLVVPGEEGTQSGESSEETDSATEGEGSPADAAQETGAVTEGQRGTQSGATPAASDKATGEPRAEMREESGEDALVAKVGEKEIRRSDVEAVIAMLPPELQQQPAEMLVPIALDQLVMRELILKEAQEAGLESDQHVESLGADAPEQAKEDAMVQVWLSEELGKAVTEEKVEETYGNLKQQFGDRAPPMESIRPQIEEELRQQAFLDLSQDLQKDADVTLYGPDGKPITK
jgi:hypothetical protein